MIIPIFRISQTSDTLTIHITVKYIKLKDMEFTIDKSEIYFYCKPYHLKLYIPGDLEQELFTSKYDIDMGVLDLTLKKTTPGEQFKNLDLITRLLSPAKEKKTRGDKVLILDDDENVLWEDTETVSYKYGFGMKGLYDFHRMIDEYTDVFNIDPRKIDIDERLELMRQEEIIKFNIDHYIADFAEEESVIKEVLDLEAPWASDSKDFLNLCDWELYILKDLPNKQYKLTLTQKEYCYFCLVDILYAYCYDCRVTSYEGNCESGWTILNLSASLKWLVGFRDARSAIESAYRRSLIYPLYRNFNLCNKVLDDLKTVLSLGPVCITKCLLHIYKIFLGGDECRYILNDIFIMDYLIFVSQLEEPEWKSIAWEVDNVIIVKEDLSLNLKEIEINFLKRVLNLQEIDSDDEPEEKYDLPEDLIELFQNKLVLSQND